MAVKIGNVGVEVAEPRGAAEAARLARSEDRDLVAPRVAAHRPMTLVGIAGRPGNAGAEVAGPRDAAKAARLVVGPRDAAKAARLVAGPRDAAKAARLAKTTTW